MRLPVSKEADPIKVLVADGDPMVSRLLTNQLKRHPQFEVAPCAGEVARVLEETAHSRPSVALIGADLMNGPLAGFGLLRQLTAGHPSVKSVLLLSQDEPNLIVDAFRSGARGVFSRVDYEFSQLCRCVCCVYLGQFWVNNPQLSCVMDALAQVRPSRVVNQEGLLLLTAREDEVVHWVIEGFSNKEIAEQMNLSGHTVKNHLFRIFDKLGISSRIELVLYAVAQNDLVSPMSRRTAALVGTQGVAAHRAASQD